MGELYATLLVRLALPLATLIAALLHFSAFGLAYLAAFAALMHRPSYSLRKHYPAPALAVLASFSIGLLVVQVTVASLIAARSLTPSDTGLWPHLDDVGIARFDRSVWDGLRAVLGPALVTAVSLLCLLAEERRSRRSFVYFMVHPGGALLLDHPRSTRLRLRQTRSLIESALVTVADAPRWPNGAVPGLGNAVATRGRWPRGRGGRHSFFPWGGGGRRVVGLGEAARQRGAGVGWQELRQQQHAVAGCALRRRWEWGVWGGAPVCAGRPRGRRWWRRRLSRCGRGGHRRRRV